MKGKHAHTTYGSVFSWTRSTWQRYYPRQHDMLRAGSWERREALGLCAQQKWFFRHWYLMEGEEPGTAAISRAPPHMEAIRSNGVLRQFPQSKRNHWNSSPSLSSPSVLLLLAQARSSTPSSCRPSLVLIIISSSAAVPRWWLEPLKVLLQISRQKKKCPCGAVYLPGFDFQIPFSTAAEINYHPPLHLKVYYSYQARTSYLFSFH